MSKNIQVGSTVKVVSGGRYLGKTGTVDSFVDGEWVKVAGSFPRSRDSLFQKFRVEDLEPTGIQFKGEAKPEGEKNLPPSDSAFAPSVVATPSVIAPVSGLASRLASKFAPSGDTAPHLIVRARAGTGKSTTILHGVRHLKNDWRCQCKGEAGFDNEGKPVCRVCESGSGIVGKLIPSPQQEAVWNAICLSPSSSSVAMTSFNKPIAEELSRKVPAGVQATTMHSLGFNIVKAAFGRVVSVNQYRVSNIIAEVMGRDIYDLRREMPVFLRVVEKLVGLCKMNLADPTPETILGLISHHDIDTDGIRDMNQVFSMVACVIERCKDVRKDNSVNFDDQIWIPVVLGLPAVRFDLLLVDEAQDLNRCQQALARKSGNRVIMVGDDRQAIYGFAGADCDSLPRMGRELGETERGCQVLPLTVTRRCGRAIVAEAQKIVPDFEAHESNPEGVVSSAVYPSKTVKVEDSFMARTADGDMVLCRVNAPLVSTCFKFLRIGRKAQIQGRDIGQGLISTIKKLKAVSVADLQKRLDLWLQNEQTKENAKRNPSEDKLIAMQDRYDCLCMFMEGAANVDEVIRKIESVFTDNKTNPGVKLSSIHKAKGLEADRVFLLQLKRASVPHPMAKTEWAREQEMNLKYVAVTRAIHELVIVTGGIEAAEEN